MIFLFQPTLRCIGGLQVKASVLLLESAHFDACIALHALIFIYHRIQKALLIWVHTDCVLGTYSITCCASTALLLFLIQYWIIFFLSHDSFCYRPNSRFSLPLNEGGQTLLTNLLIFSSLLFDPYLLTTNEKGLDAISFQKRALLFSFT